MSQSIHQIDRKKIDVLSKLPLREVRAMANSDEVLAQSELARRLFRLNRKKDALGWLRKAASSNNPDCQMELGIYLFWDYGEQREGFKWIRRAAEQGHIGAQYFLGSELATGENIHKNLSEAARWYRRAAMRNHSEAQYNLALMYWTGEGVSQSRTASHRWLEKAARQNDLLALRAITEAYENGILGYRKNHRLARYWQKRYSLFSRKSKHT